MKSPGAFASLFQTQGKEHEDEKTGMVRVIVQWPFGCLQQASVLFFSDFHDE